MLIAKLKPTKRSWILLLLHLLVATLPSSSSSAVVDGESDGVGGKWHILTKQNFSSQIRLHPHILLFVSVPWSGEARSLMKQVTELVTSRQEEYSRLKLMYINRNNEKMLADGIGASSREGITILYYHLSLPYKYQGKFDAKRILSSILPYLGVLAAEIPLKTLNSEEDLKMFVESTDKAVLLFEFCGWSTKLIAINNSNATENGFAVEGFNGEINGIPMSVAKENQKGTESANLKCGIDDVFSGIPLLGVFSSVNNSAALQETNSQDMENINSSGGMSCTFEKLRQFDSFFSSFLNVARELFLPAERHRFGLVSDKSLFSSLGVEDSGSWAVMLHYSGCPTCSKILKEGDDLKSVLLMDKSVVRELQGDGYDADPAIPANKPSVLLFVDRLSDLSESRQKSKEALDAFRELALHYETSDLIGEQNSKYERPPSIPAFQQYGGISEHPRLQLSPTAQKIKSKDKMSIMIVNEGKHGILDNIASDLQGSSLHEILTDLLRKKGTATLSSMAKDMGFQLLSNDMDIKITDTLPSKAEVESKVSFTPSKESLVGTSADLVEIAASNHDERFQHSNIRSFSQDEEEKITNVKPNRNSELLKPDQFVLDHGLAIAEDIKESEQKSSSQVEWLGEEQHSFQHFKGSFYFCDGNYRLLRALTGETRIPSLVITDPILQQHYVLPEQTILSYSSLEDFLHGFLNGSLVPYGRSEAKPERPRESIHPPFVNMDFHESDSIPRVTAHTFTELVLGFNKSYDDSATNAWNEDVLVLFSNNWCGFCQRMELIVREVYRAVKGYMNMLQTKSLSGETMLSGDNLKKPIPKLPKILLMDCTLNDCSLVLKSMDQREVYPALILFPAEKKTSVSYEGDMAVADVIKFMADHGTNSRYLTSEKGILWTVTKKRSKNQDLFKETSATTTYEKDTLAKKKSHEILLKNLTPKRTVELDKITSHAPKGLPETTTPNVVVGSILSATEKLSTQPFDKSMILIVKADQSTGFQGLIYNKPITWDSLHELEEGSERLKTAPLSFGGPLMKLGMPLVALTRRVVKGQYPEVVPGIYFLDQSATRNEIQQLKSGNQSLTDYWFFLGFSSWGWDQLFDEIAAGAWNLSESKGHFDWPYT